ncbi:MAG: pyridoxal phosphate-dependent aminotransferase [Planctomycetota bacterium]|nr:pyridoxal phosphate-dependent aminotransferase [Planctomycetota bacterium]
MSTTTVSSQLASRMGVLGTETAFEVFAKAKALEAQGKNIVHLHIGAPDFNTPPNIVAAGEKALRDGWHKYTPANGLPDLREAVCEDILRYRGAEVNPDNVLIVPGGKPTMFYAIMMFGEPGAEIMYPNPGFPIYESMIHWSGAKAVPIELKEENDFSFDADSVLSKITPNTRLMIVNTPANPTGGIVQRSEMDKLVAGLEKHPHVTILCDEIYSRQLYDGAEHVSILQYPSLADRAIMLDGWSKTYAMTGWRLGYGVWPDSLIKHAERLQINSTSCANAVTQVAAIEALRGPQDSVDEMLKAFDERRHVMHRELNAIPGISCVMPKGAFYAFPNITGTGRKSQDLENGLLNEAGVACLSGTAFGAMGEGYLRFSYANSVEQIQEGLRRVKEYLA